MFFTDRPMPEIKDDPVFSYKKKTKTIEIPDNKLKEIIKDILINDFGISKEWIMSLIKEGIVDEVVNMIKEKNEVKNNNDKAGSI